MCRVSAYLKASVHAFRQSQHNQSGCGFIDQQTVKWLCVCRDAVAWCYRLPCLDQHCAVWRVEAALTDSGLKDIFLPKLRVEMPEDNIDVMGRAFVLQFL